MQPGFLLYGKMRPSVFLPAPLVVVCAGWLFFTVTYSGYPRWVYTQINKVLFCRLRPSLAKGHIVFRGSPFITVAFNKNFRILIGFQVIRICLKNRPGLFLDKEPIKIKEYILQL